MTKIIKDPDEGNIVEIPCEQIGGTRDAIRITDGTKEVWLPKSQIFEKEYDEGILCTVYLPEWLAIEKELV